MTLWVVRAGRYGEREVFAVEAGRAVIGWDELPDLGAIDDRGDLEAMVRAAYPEFSPGRTASHTGQLWAFLRRMAVGDLVALPLKNRPAIAVGEVTGDYRHDPDAAPGLHHSRPVRWLRTDLPRGAFYQDLLHSLGGMLTVFQVTRNDAENRVRQMVEGRTPPRKAIDDAVSEDAAEVVFSVKDHATDQVREHIGRRYRGHQLSHLVAAILEAQGYHVYTAPPGADGGVDVLAAGGAMGFGAPRIAVQVKSGDAPLDVSVLRELQGVMPRFGADQGLIVSWGGFKDTVYKEARQLFFSVRLWTSNDLIAALAEHYDRLDDRLQADIPMKRVWALVVEE